jgi:anti-anti-sigma regulatory factor
MKVKIDTKEKFHVITITDPHFTAILAAELSQLVTKFLQEKIRHVVLNFANVVSIEDNAAEQIAALQQSFYENNASFVICGIQPAVEDRLEELELSETMNTTPTESEAWDIVQMEEIERELLDSEDVEFPSHGEKD